MRIGLPILFAASIALMGCEVTVAPPVNVSAPTSGKGTVTPNPPIATPVPPVTSGINFGNDSGGFPFDNECDDPRFQGNGVAADNNINSANQFRDATDCRRAVTMMGATLRPGGGAGFPRVATPPTPSINYGNDSSPFAFDGECDDPRFQGNNVVHDAGLDPSNQFRDATDCRRAVNVMGATLRPGGGAGFPRAVTPPATSINFGNDSGGFPFDGECDDPRFHGPGMAASSSLNAANNFRDATDCRNLFNAGRVMI